MIDQNLLVQWYVDGILPRIRSTLFIYKITNYEDALQKALRFDLDDDSPMTSLMMEIFEEKI
jgi:hypothetical protein